MKSLFLIPVIALLFSVENVNAQAVTVTNYANTTPALSDGYASLADVINDLQLITSIAGPVTITLNPSNPQTAPQGGYVISFGATTTASTVITIKGNNNVITAFPHQATGSVNDAIFKIVGADYINIRDFNIQENGNNFINDAATNDMTEWGIALLKATASNGAQYNTIENNTISLNRNYSNSFGIYSNTNHSATDVLTSQPITNGTTSPNKENKIFGNTINNVNMGIAFIGSSIADFMDENNDVGGASALTGNTITNWGGLLAQTAFLSNAAFSYCILMNHQKNENVSYNIITSATLTGASVSLSGILKDYSVTSPTGTFTSNITNNSITIKNNFSTNTYFDCITSQGISVELPTATININNNYFLNNALINTTVTGGMQGINNSSACGKLNMNGNIFRGNVFGSTGDGASFINNSAAVSSDIHIDNNQLGDAIGNCVTIPAGMGGQINGIYSNNGFFASLSISGNNFEGFVPLGANSTSYFFIYYASIQYAATTVNINNNTFTNLNLNTYELVMLIARNGGFMTDYAGATMNINNNRIVGSFTKLYATGVPYAAGMVLVYDAGSSGPGNFKNITGNDFSNINTGSGGMDIIDNYDGSSFFGGPTVTISDNVFNNINIYGTGRLIRKVSTADNTYITNNIISNVLCTSILTAIEIGQDSITGITSKIVCSGNKITGISTSGTGSGSIDGIIASTHVDSIFINDNIISDFYSTKGAITQGIQVGNGDSTITNVFNNKIYNLTATHISASAEAVGINIPAGAGGVNNIYNNIIADLKSLHTNNANGVRGIHISSSAANAKFNLYYNTIYLDAPASDGTNFGSSAIFATADANPLNALLTLRNNIIINTSAVHGGGVTTVLRRSSSALANYSTASNNNILYAGTPSATNVFLRYGTTSYQTLAAYKTKVNPSDANSFTELPPFLNTTVGSSPDYLHINAAAATQAESGAVNITGIKDDIDAQVRQGNTGYIGTGTAPDIGADEFDGFIVVPVSITTISANRIADKTITVKWKGENEINLDKYILERSANGQNFTMISFKTPALNNGGTANYQYNDIKPLPGNNFYRIKSTSLDSRIQYSAIVKVGPEPQTNGISIYPNPVEDKIFNIRFINMAAGNYKLKLTNKLGQSVYNNNVKIDDNNTIISVQLENNLVAGNYQLSVIAADGETFVQQIVTR